MMRRNVIALVGLASMVSAHSARAQKAADLKRNAVGSQP
jgi:hypothetical protein